MPPEEHCKSRRMLANVTTNVKRVFLGQRLTSHVVLTSC